MGEWEGGCGSCLWGLCAHRKWLTDLECCYIGVILVSSVCEKKNNRKKKMTLKKFSGTPALLVGCQVVCGFCV